MPNCKKGSKPASRRSCYELTSSEHPRDQQTLLNAVMNKKGGAPMPLVDVGDSWMGVAWRGLVDNLCIIPGASAFVMKFIYVLGLQLVQKASPAAKTYCKSCRIDCLVIDKLSLASSSASDILFVLSCWLALEKKIELRLVVEQIQLRQISRYSPWDQCCFGTFFCCISLKSLHKFIGTNTAPWRS